MASDLEICELYGTGMSTGEVADRIGVDPSTIRRALKRQGVQLRKRWSAEHGVKDGQKQCRMCNKWQPKENFYARKKGGLYSYCKPCDRERAVDTGRKSRQAKKQQEQTIRSERRRHNSQSRAMLLDVLKFLDCRFPDIDLAQEIKAHLMLGQRLFGDRKV